jgi:hypothetical protein
MQLVVRSGRVAIAISVVVAMNACGDCAAVGWPAVSVGVVDYTTGAPAASGAVLYVFRHQQTEVLDSSIGKQDAEKLVAAWEQRGRFDVLVEKAGFFPWTATNVQVTGDCSVETVSLTARIRRRP